MVAMAGGEKLNAYLRETANKVSNPGTLRVGFLESATYDDGKPVAMIAAIQNFGAPAKGIPPRPFFSNMIAEKGPKWPEQLGQLLKANGMDAKKALAMMGEGIAGQLRQSIVDTNSPPNSPVTDLLKQRFPMGGQTFDDVLTARRDVAAGVNAPAGKPLVQSGHMLGSVDFEITDAGA
jgi:hypothetical protein